MAAGLPVVITQRVGAKDLVTDGVEGFILNQNPTPADLGTKIAALLNREHRMTMGSNARTTALQNTWDRVADQVEAIYQM
jgi:glycosyltransferase involved in cell wall biosynthesis